MTITELKQEITNVKTDCKMFNEMLGGFHKITIEMVTELRKLEKQLIKMEKKLK